MLLLSRRWVARSAALQECQVVESGDAMTASKVEARLWGQSAFRSFPSLPLAKGAGQNGMAQPPAHPSSARLRCWTEGFVTMHEAIRRLAVRDRQSGAARQAARVLELVLAGELSMPNASAVLH
jgi:hypothetical protein